MPNNPQYQSQEESAKAGEIATYILKYLKRNYRKEEPNTIAAGILLAATYHATNFLLSEDSLASDKPTVTAFGKELYSSLQSVINTKVNSMIAIKQRETN